MGGKGAQPENNQVVQMQEMQAAQSAEATRQTNARLQQGVSEIDQLFGGTPSGASLLDLSGIANGTAPSATPQQQAAINWGQTHGNPSGAASVQAMVPKNSLADGYSWGTLPSTGGPTSYGIYDPSGNLVTDATSLSDLAASKIYVGGDPNQTTGGFDDDFFNKYTNAQLGYYMPAEDRQFTQAKTNLDYGLARAGTLNSSAANKGLADLAYQDTLNKAQIQSTADTATAQLRDTVASDKNSAINQLYSTENPSVAASTAAGLVGNVQLTTPQLNPIGQLFTPIAVGTGNAIAGYTNPASYLPSTGSGVAQTSSGASGSSNIVNG
jgi:hypothetical protein